MQIKNLLYTLTLIIIFSSCAKKPHNVGESLISPDEYYLIKDTILTDFTISNYKYVTPLWQTERFIIGKNDSIEAISIFNFNPSATLSDTLNSVKIDTAEISLISSYLLNTPNNKSEFEIFEMPIGWDYKTFTGDSLKNFNLINPIGTLSDTIINLKQFKFLVDTLAIRKFINDQIDSTKPAFNGFAIKSKINENGFAGFYSFQTSFQPNLKIKFSKNGVRDSITITSGLSTFGVNEKISSLPNQEKLILQSSLNYRSQLKFNLKNIPQNAIINKASLELILSKKTIGIGTTDSLIVSINRKEINADSNILFPLYIFRQTADSLSYLANLTTFTQSWVIDSTSNLGILIRSAYENNSIDKYEFFSAGNKPKLKITYSLK